MRKAGIGFLSICFFLLLGASPAAAQDSQSQPLNLSTAIDLALRNYPSVRASQAQAAAAEAGIDVARVAYLPRLDTLWQQNLATRNNVFGEIFSQSVIPQISGPVLERSSLRGATGSAGGALLSWEPFDFGLRRANVGLARATRKQAGAGVAVTRLDVAFAAADAFLGMIANEQIVRAAQVNVDRMEAFAIAVQALVDSELRPGVDASRANAELAAARNQLIQAQQDAEIIQATFAEAIGRAGAPVTIDAGPLLTLPSPPPLVTPNFAAHPLARAQAASLETAQSRERVLERSYFPRFNFQSAVFGRGTGARIDGSFDNSKGLFPNTGNWAAGMTITFPAFDIFGIRARRRVECNNVQAEQARYDQTIQTLKTQDAKARAMIEAARRIAENTPIQLKAAQETDLRARVRYENGLANVIEVAEAQRLLAQAEADDAVARLAVWRALLIAARAQGDLTPFLEQVAKTPIKGKQ
ncbi:MAG TPA: TolC family protein [Blastocatellia bacterium]|nr:TolC family protein [Blastocatellia bacterium]